MANERKVFIFAYGSNLSTQRMRSRACPASPVAVGYVSRHAFVFHKRSDDGSAKADAAYTDSLKDRVWGAVYSLHQHQKPLLDQHEFLGIGYDEKTVEVVHENGVLQAWMYVARQDAIDSSLLPYSWYHDLIIHGACEHRLPIRYIDRLREFNSLLDPDAARHSANRRLIHG